MMWNTLEALFLKFYRDVERLESLGRNQVAIRQEFERHFNMQFERRFNNFGIFINGLLSKPGLVENLSHNWNPEAWLALFYMKSNDFLHCRQNMLAPVLNNFNGSHWSWLLKHVPKPEFADKCYWCKLEWGDVKDLLEKRPDIVILHRSSWRRWHLLTGKDWAELLYKHPEFADQCEYWNKLKGEDWSYLLCKQPQFADNCNWSKLKGQDWVNLLCEQTQFADICEQHLNDLRAADLNILLDALHISKHTALATLEARFAAKINVQKKIELDQLRQRAAARVEALRDFNIPPPRPPLHNPPDPYYE